MNFLKVKCFQRFGFNCKLAPLQRGDSIKEVQNSELELHRLKTAVEVRGGRLVQILCRRHFWFLVVVKKGSN